VGFVVKTVLLGQVLFQVLQSSPVSNITPVLPIHILLVYDRCYKILLTQEHIHIQMKYIVQQHFHVTQQCAACISSHEPSPGTSYYNNIKIISVFQHAIVR